MRLARYRKRNGTHLGLVWDSKILSLTDVGKVDPNRYGPLANALDLIPLLSGQGRLTLEKIDRQIKDGGLPGEWAAFSEPEKDAEWLPPVASPEKIICIGLNYRDHAAESKMEIPKEPVIFNKYNNALVGAAGPVLIPSNSQQVDYEAELAVVIGASAKRVSREESSRFVAGYTLMHDVSARDWQFRTGQWMSGKTFDTFGPCGPHLVTPDEVPDPHNLDIRLTLNGQVMQDSNTSNLIFDIPTLISYISHIFTLKAGDIISTGTPPGVGFARRPQVFLKDGDFVEIFVEKVGLMQHRCTAEKYVSDPEIVDN